MSEQYFNVMEFSSMPAGFFTLFILLAIWSLIWKGIALWKAARNGSKPWFIVLLVINTVGILEIVYIFFFSKKKQQSNL
ncbi:MAG: DUF5652 family protein [bacterium]